MRPRCTGAGHRHPRADRKKHLTAISSAAKRGIPLSVRRRRDREARGEHVVDEFDANLPPPARTGLGKRSGSSAVGPDGWRIPANSEAAPYAALLEIAFDLSCLI